MPRSLFVGPCSDEQLNVLIDGAIAVLVRKYHDGEPLDDIITLITALNHPLELEKVGYLETDGQTIYPNRITEAMKPVYAENDWIFKSVNAG